MYRQDNMLKGKTHGLEGIWRTGISYIQKISLFS